MISGNEITTGCEYCGGVDKCRPFCIINLSWVIYGLALLIVAIILFSFLI